MEIQIRRSRRRISRSCSLAVGKAQKLPNNKQQWEMSVALIFQRAFSVKSSPNCTTRCYVGSRTIWKNQSAIDNQKESGAWIFGSLIVYQWIAQEAWLHGIWLLERWERGVMINLQLSQTTTTTTTTRLNSRLNSRLNRHTRGQLQKCYHGILKVYISSITYIRLISESLQSQKQIKDITNNGYDDWLGLPAWVTVCTC